MWLAAAQLANVLPPAAYQIGQNKLPAGNVDLVFSANTLHILSESLVKQLILDLGDRLKSGTRVVFYGPFKYQGQFTSESNADFDLWLKDIDPLRGIRGIEWVEKLMKAQGFALLEDFTMPANNQMLLFEKAK
jgi:hypothetical protein